VLLQRFVGPWSVFEPQASVHLTDAAQDDSS
jgi:hypothetical protein